MNIVPTVSEITSLPALVDRAATTLANARTAAEVLEAREMAGFAYDAAKRASRVAKAKGAFDELIVAVYRAQADALEIEAGANRRLADEYDAAQAPLPARTRRKPARPRPADAGAGLAIDLPVGPRSFSRQPWLWPEGGLINVRGSRSPHGRPDQRHIGWRAR